MMSVLIQILASVIVCFPCLNMGLLGSLPSSTLADFTSPNTSLDRPMTEMEVNLYGSLSSAGALVTTPVVAVLLDRLGRKRCTVLAGLMAVISWVILASTRKVELLLIAVFLGGASGTSFLIVPAYCSEFCQESIRGTMTAGSMVFYGIGALVSYILGGYLEYTTMVYVAMGFSVMQLVLMGWLEESPTVLLKNGLEEAAAKSVAFYRRADIKSKVVLQELANIRRALNPGELELVPQKEHADNETKASFNDARVHKKLSLYQNFRTSAPLRRGILITVVMMTAAIFQGSIAVTVYAEPIFVEAVPSMSPTTCSLSVAVAIVGASVVGAYLSDLVGRRPLIIYCSMASGVCCVLIGTQMQLQWAPEWLTAAFMYIFSVVYSFGGGTVPFVLLSEVFLPEVKSVMTMIIVEWMWLCFFIVLLLFYPLASLLGMGGVFHVFAGVCVSTSIFSILYVPETKGLSLDEVQQMLVERRNH